MWEIGRYMLKYTESYKASCKAIFILQRFINVTDLTSSLEAVDGDKMVFIVLNYTYLAMPN